MPKTATAPIVPAVGQYRIAAVSRITGMPVPTIRMWERRHAVVVPARSAGNGRLYSRSDIDRLMLLKSAVDAGHAIGTIATLSDQQIGERLVGATGGAAGSLPQECRVLVCGSGIAERLRTAWVGRHDVRIAATLPGLAADGVAGAVEAVIVEAPSLLAVSIRELRQLRMRTHARVMVVVYGFGNRQALARLDQEGIIALALPADPAQLARICLLSLAIDQQPVGNFERRLMQPAAPRRYDDRFLASIAGLPSAIRCECPNHLADLLAKLNAFEQYSLDCESTGTADASVHALLYSSAAQCRELLERALGHVLRHEGVADPTTPGAAAVVPS